MAKSNRQNKKQKHNNEQKNKESYILFGMSLFLQIFLILEDLHPITHQLALLYLFQNDKVLKTCVKNVCQIDYDVSTALLHNAYNTIKKKQK